MSFLWTLLLYVITALAEIGGCFLVLRWTSGNTAWLLLPATLVLACFAWLLTLHPTASGRVYAAYGGVYVATALAWLRYVDQETLRWTDVTGAGVALLGMAIIMLGARG